MGMTERDRLIGSLCHSCRDQRFGIGVHLGRSSGCGNDKIVVCLGTGNQAGSGSGSVIDRGMVIGCGQNGRAGATWTVFAHPLSSSAHISIIGRGLRIGVPCNGFGLGGRRTDRRPLVNGGLRACSPHRGYQGLSQRPFSMIGAAVVPGRQRKPQQRRSERYGDAVAEDEG